MSDTPTCWYVLRVKPRHERIVAEELQRRECESFVPAYTEIRQWSDRRKKVDVCLFPGYVFCCFGLDRRITVLRTPGVASIVSFGDSPAVVPDEELAAVRSIIASGLPARPCPFLQVGDRVHIGKGCLSGVSGILVREKTSWRVVVSVTILQRSVAVELDRTMITALEVLPARLGIPAENKNTLPSAARG